MGAYMKQTTNRALKAYSQINIEAAINSANPVQLIVILYDGALTAIATAQGQIQQNNYELKGGLISRAIEIIEALKTVIDREKGGEIAENLIDLYEYINRQLMIANLKNDKNILDGVSKILLDLRGAWAEIAAPKNTQIPPSIEPQNRSAMSYGKA